MYKDFHSKLTLVAKTFGIDLQPIIQQWCGVYESRLQHCGKKDAVKFCKELNTVGERYALRQNITAIPWTKSDANSFPSCISKFKPYLRSKDPRKVVFGLSVLRTCEDLRLPISKDISSITMPSQADENLIKEIASFAPQWVSRLQRVSLRGLKYHFTVKNGPNGHALHASDSDISAVMNDTKLFEAIQTIQRKLKDVSPMETKGVITDPNAIHSKLTQFPEKSGKTRTIAIVDYYSQRCLKSLHDSIMKLLASLVSDGTYSHQNVGKFAQQSTSEKRYIYCADLTAFTDRFPSEIQRALLFALLRDDELSQAYWTLLAERTFKLAWSDERVTYSCGQPMGAYSSWPLCSLAHHLLVEYTAHKEGIANSKHLYRMIGDDVIITNQKLASAYQKNIQLLGVEINLGKTVCTPEASKYSGAEVAKQLYLNGTCLTPLTPGFVRSLGNPYTFNTCMRILKSRYDFIRPETPSMLARTFFQQKKRFELVWLLCTNPITGAVHPEDPGYDLSPWISKDLEQVRKDFHKMVVNRLLDKAMAFIDQSFELLMSGGSPWKGSNPPPRCLRYIRMDIDKQLTKATDRLGDISIGARPEDLVAEFDFIPDPTTPYMERKEMRDRRMSSLIVSLFSYEDNTNFIQLDW